MKNTTVTHVALKNGKPIAMRYTYEHPTLRLPNNSRQGGLVEFTFLEDSVGIRMSQPLGGTIHWQEEQWEISRKEWDEYGSLMITPEMKLVKTESL